MFKYQICFAWNDNCTYVSSVYSLIFEIYNQKHENMHVTSKFIPNKINTIHKIWYKMEHNSNTNVSW